MYFQQDADFRIDNMLVLKFVESSAELLKDIISYRINAAYQINEMIKNRLKDICRIVEIKNPNLMKQIKKGTLETGPGGNIQNSSSSKIEIK